MKNKTKLIVGWFGVLTPVYAAGVLTVLLVIGDTALVGGIIVVSIINCFMGYKVLKSKLPEKGAKKHGNSNRI